MSLYSSKQYLHQSKQKGRRREGRGERGEGRGEGVIHKRTGASCSLHFWAMVDVSNDNEWELTDAPLDTCGIVRLGVCECNKIILGKKVKYTCRFCIKYMCCSAECARAYLDTHGTTCDCRGVGPRSNGVSVGFGFRLVASNHHYIFL